MADFIPISDSSHLNSIHNEVLIFHEAGHAVMARLFGRRVHKIDLVLNVENTYNGYTYWGRDEIMREWDQNVPYVKLGLQQSESKIAVALVFAAGKAAERIWYRQHGLDESQASYGPGGGDQNDEREIEKELSNNYPQLKPQELPLGREKTEELAIRLLEAKACWNAVEAVAQALLAGIKQVPKIFSLDEVQKLISQVFAQLGSAENSD